MFVPKEKLPDQCPPDGAVEISGLFVRLVSTPDFDSAFCDSNCAQGKVARKNADPCLWAACSLIIYDQEWPEGPVARIREFAEGARLLQHKPYAALLELPVGAGLGRRGSESSPHFSFWMAKDFDPTSVVREVLELL